MTMIAMVSAKGAPGVTTSVAALASVWPAPLVVADADPAGGDIVGGWLGASAAAGRLRRDRGVFSYATRARHLGAGAQAMLDPHLQPVPGAPNVRLLAGLDGPEQSRLVDMSDWRRLGRQLADLGGGGGRTADVLVDCGRWGADTPWPLLTAADLVLITVRPQRRYVLLACPFVTTLRKMIPVERLGLMMCGSTPLRTTETEHCLGLPAVAELPEDRHTARMFSDGGHSVLSWRPSRLLSAAGHAAEQLHSGARQGTPLPPRLSTSAQRRSTRSEKAVPTDNAGASIDRCGYTADTMSIRGVI